MRLLPFLLSLTFICSACSLRQITVDQTAQVFKHGAAAMDKEWDYELAATSFAPTIKTLETFLYSSPQNPVLLKLLARLYSGYGMVVLEDQLERMAASSDDLDANPAVEQLRLRAKEMHLRAHRYGLRLLETHETGAKETFKKGREALEKFLASCDEDDVEGLFWAAAPLSMAINVDREDVALMGNIAKIKAILERVVALNEGFYFANAHVILGSLYGSVGPMLGGDAKRAREHFERALKLTKRRFLLVQLMYAKTLAVQVQDRKLFDALLDEVDKADINILVDQRLANVGAKRQATRLRARASELF
ncbi:MAG: hypothetical protein JRH20_03270 [Deltaproteobacteria bacterium]|nr:hypothetical protein [Deltaproteobacteria bacterium]